MDVMHADDHSIILNPHQTKLKCDFVLFCSYYLMIMALCTVHSPGTQTRSLVTRMGIMIHAEARLPQHTLGYYLQTCGHYLQEENHDEGSLKLQRKLAIR